MSPGRTRFAEWRIGMSVAAAIEAKLRAALQPARLQIVDESHLHKGHGGYRPGGESHFRVEIVSAAFEGHSRVARQRRVYEILSDELKAGVHALTLTTLTPAEDV
jgi:BolA protein